MSYYALDIRVENGDVSNIQIYFQRQVTLITIVNMEEVQKCDDSEIALVEDESETLVPVTRTAVEFGKAAKGRHSAVSFASIGVEL